MEILNYELSGLDGLSCLYKLT